MNRIRSQNLSRPHMKITTSGQSKKYTFSFQYLAIENSRISHSFYAGCINYLISPPRVYSFWKLLDINHFFSQSDSTVVSPIYSTLQTYRHGVDWCQRYRQ